MSKRKKPGPPPLPPDQKRGYGVLVKLNRAERDVVKARAGRQPLGAYLRDKGLAS